MCGCVGGGEGKGVNACTEASFFFDFFVVAGGAFLCFPEHFRWPPACQHYHKHFYQLIKKRVGCLVKPVGRGMAEKSIIGARKESEVVAARPGRVLEKGWWSLVATKHGGGSVKRSSSSSA